MSEEQGGGGGAGAGDLGGGADTSGGAAAPEWLAGLPDELKADAGLAKIQYGVYTLGVAIMTPSLYVMLTGSPAMEPLVATGSLIAFAGVLLFAVILFKGE